MRTIAAFSLLFAVGCGQSPAGLVLVFPTDQDRMDAAHAAIIVVKAMGDQCPQFLAFPPAEPDAANIEQTIDIDLNDGVPSRSLKGVPTGQQTLLIKVQNKQGTLFLHGCRTGSIAAEQHYEITLQPLMIVNNDFSVGPDGPIDDLASPPPDMAQHKFIQVTTVELRANTRKIANVAITISDSGSNMVMGTTDATGIAKVDITNFVGPFKLLANAPLVGGYAGGVSLSGLTPTFNGDTAGVTVPIELDPPAAAGTITVSVTDDVATPYTVYWQGAHAISSDPTGSGTVTGPQTIGPLIANGNFRVAATTATRILTSGPVLSTGSTYSTVKGASFAATGLTLTYVHSTNGLYNTSQSYGIHLALPAPPTQLAVPLMTETAFVASGSSAAINVPTTPSSIQPIAVIQTEMIADGSFNHAESRHQVNAGATTDSFAMAVPDPPNITMPSPSPTPSPVPAANSFALSASMPGQFSLSSTFVHIHIYDATKHVNWHIVQPAANPAVVNVPGMVLFAGTYTVDVAFVQDFMIPDGTLAATEGDDWSKLIRPLPQLLSQSSLSLTVN